MRVPSSDRRYVRPFVAFTLLSSVVVACEPFVDFPDVTAGDGGGESLDGAQPQGWGAPKTLATGQNEPAGVAVLQGAVYWVNAGDTNVVTVDEPADGGFHLRVPASDLVTDGTVLFAMSTQRDPGDGNQSGVVIKPGTTDPAFVEQFNSPVVASAIAASSSELYLAGTAVKTCGGLAYTEGPATSAGAWPVPLCSSNSDLPTALFSGSAGALYLGTQGGHLYELLGTADGGGSLPAPIADATSPIASIVADAQNIYWLTGAGEVVALPVTSAHAPDGGAVITLASGQDNPKRLATDGANLYWTNAGTPNQGDGSLCALAVSPAGAPVVTLASKQASPFGVTTARANGLTTVYWTNQGDGTVKSITQLGP